MAWDDDTDITKEKEEITEEETTETTVGEKESSDQNIDNEDFDDKDEVTEPAKKSTPRLRKTVDTYTSSSYNKPNLLPNWIIQFGAIIIGVFIFIIVSRTVLDQLLVAVETSNTTNTTSISTNISNFSFVFSLLGIGIAILILPRMINIFGRDIF